MSELSQDGVGVGVATELEGVALLEGVATEELEGVATEELEGVATELLEGVAEDCVCLLAKEAG